MSTTATNSDRLRKMIKDLGNEYPKIWQIIDDMRSQKGKSLPKWADWCFLPMAGAYAMANQGKDSQINIKKISDVARISALAAWRVSQEIYRFHPETFKRISETPLKGDLPSELIYRLPEWCVYIELQGDTPEKPESKDHGFFAHLEDDHNTGHHELRILVDSERGFLPIIIHLEKPTLREAILETFEEIKRRRLAGESEYEATQEEKDKLIRYSERLVGLVLYLCSNGVDLTGRGKIGVRPEKPQLKKTRKGPRFFPPEQPTIWEVGFRIGKALEAARELQTDETSGGTHGSPKPHIRRAHWHSFWKGPIKEPTKRHLVVYWLPPIAVGIKELDELIR